MRLGSSVRGVPGDQLKIDLVNPGCDRVLDHDARAAVLRSAERYIAAIR